eukprot:CAMPEP_0172713426 /NCGR_PEP_ID=MMETSP1074-20121228/62403_1 /TAXON_ID=2916 /ORGANISM="Ceratium fusus, Strain PA161109" /LENGTH=148 /DNA_ID=CAMNT_0013537521 /DNA_START=181 /DNA_END=629 /DNA_ORIENTATION=-
MVGQQAGFNCSCAAQERGGIISGGRACHCSEGRIDSSSITEGSGSTTVLTWPWRLRESRCLPPAPYGRSGATLESSCADAVGTWPWRVALLAEAPWGGGKTILRPNLCNRRVRWPELPGPGTSEVRCSSRRGAAVNLEPSQPMTFFWA